LEQEYRLDLMEHQQARGERNTLLSILQDPVSAMVLYGLRGRSGDKLALQRNRVITAPATSAPPNGTLLASLAACRGDTMEHFIDRLWALRHAVEASLTRKAARIARVRRTLLDNVARH
jgi:hypothetical protein